MFLLVDGCVNGVYMFGCLVAWVLVCLWSGAFQLARISREGY